jgi:WASH complex subunit strumpellin
LQPLGSVPEGSIEAYEQAIRASSSAWDDTLAAFATIGQAQLLRRQLNAELVANIRIDSHTLSRALDTVNRAILTDIRAHYKSPDTVPYPDEANAIVPKLSAYLSASGMQNPLRQIYCTVAAVDDDWGLAAFVFTLTQLELYRFDDVASTLAPINPSVTKVDAHVLIIAVSTTLRQFHMDQTTSYLSHLGAYARAEISAPSSSSSTSSIIFSPRVRACVAWARTFAAAHDVDFTVLSSFFPPFVFSHAFVA